MDRDRVVRRALRASVVFNLGGALLFLFPESIGQLAGLPTPVPRVYSAALAMLVALFGVTYAWLARQPHIDRPLVTFFTFGKAGFFAVVFVCWLFGEAPAPALLAAVGDLAFAAIFAWWLVTTAEAPAAPARVGAAGPAGYPKG
jgi:hypothetical protein